MFKTVTFRHIKALWGRSIVGFLSIDDGSGEVYNWHCVLINYKYNPLNLFNASLT